jgi:hypothetical protein
MTGQPIGYLGKSQRAHQVRFEPEDHLGASAPGSVEQLVPFPHRREQVGLPTPTAGGKMRGPNLGELGRRQAGGHRAVVQHVAPRQEVLDRQPDDRRDASGQCIAGSYMQGVHATTVPDKSVS